MSLGVVVDVAIGLALIYLLLGLIASAVQETVATALKLRGRQLRDGLAALIAGNGTDAMNNPLFQAVFQHATVQGIAGNGLPSYVSARNFSTALFDVLSGRTQAPLLGQFEAAIAALPPGAAKTSLSALLTQAGGDIDKFRASVETWFDDAMDRLSGVYKRFNHYFALALGLAIAIVFNVDTITVAKTLWADPDKRAAIVAVASGAAAPGEPDPAADIIRRAQAAQSQLDGLQLPIGWPVTAGQTIPGAIWGKISAADGSGVWAVVGWLTTALAVSLGAPFWFDLLQKLFNLRGSGPKPARADEAA